MGDPLGVNNLTTKLMIENRQSSEKVCSGPRQTVRFWGRAVPTAGLVLHMRIA
ncbi:MULTISPECIES: hypothetical protein [Paraburkholderia]|uniref:hypothetical protein n=1 Tax=Paraburkholderia TaxID=1822464 RepID=UPI001BA80080|nr:MULTISPECIES: hypothetical protein [Paraburkholderia]MCX4152673.1 hypothetical protein [Paraburkholderia aspalathi]MDN7162088.1 hypothetical protein [Paraburkholderia sp. SECH2]MDQ6390574.1 hypothetical protein [Paraburkholderia aspalathi]